MKPDRRGPEADREQRVGLGRDAADLDEQVLASSRPDGCPTSSRSCGRPVRRPHEGLADQDGVVAGLGQPAGVGRRRGSPTRPPRPPRPECGPPARRPRSWSTWNVRRSRWLTPISPAPAPSAAPAPPRRAPRPARPARAASARAAQPELVIVDSAAAMSSTASAPIRRASTTSASCTVKSLRSTGRPEACRAAARSAGEPPKKSHVGQDREAGGAARDVVLGHQIGLQPGVQVPLGRGTPLDLRDARQAAAPQRTGEVPGRRRARRLFDQVGQGRGRRPRRGPGGRRGCPPGRWA